MLQRPLLGLLLVGLDLVADFEVGPVREADAAFGALAHFGDVLLHALEGGEGACECWISCVPDKVGVIGESMLGAEE